MINGWRVYFLKRLFGKQRRDLREEVRRLKGKLSHEEYIRHPTVKLYAAVMRAIKEGIPTDPLASRFALTGPLKQYSRVKKMGMPNRYRLFFKVFQAAEQKSIFILWLGYPRKEGDKKDCYKAFRKIVERGDFPETLDELLLESEQD
ncbi:type II toxin-antitoxin system YhaV family toxin [cf. Phormidesmis sp. LEGE 11477]|uniref:type II toxin-antitoxin system YhaV family toxin n=1 Tax=cf. Phormidesmis sp. LEGE 11477 TaxID=1828680 RepID=UPI00187FE861|nr:type II toxin-antitoxin system YhaV family toxin [cf. Phormidesmis sp. LEGE 11477]MBE9059893.1 type II toxin-antitoxin system YhaV family toxin [cf. Phormidesmis sp. LEGE 11477]